MNVAIFGATSHIAKNLIYYFLEQTDDYLYLFVRNFDSIQFFLESIQADPLRFRLMDYCFFDENAYDAVINCIGIADPAKQKTAGIEMFRVTEFYDNLIISYIEENSATKYISFSSGAIYGSSFIEPVGIDSVAGYKVNSLASGDYYRISKINSEAKHRALNGFFIVDIRLFSFFSRFQDLHSSFLMTELVNCVLENKVFITNNIDIIRDYIHPEDLFLMIQAILLKKSQVNIAFDACSYAPISKFSIIEYFQKKFDLHIQITELNNTSPTGIKSVYYSNNHADIHGYESKRSSLETISEESENIMLIRGFEIQEKKTNAD